MHNEPTYRERTKPWYGTARWKRRRTDQLTKEPLCWMCLETGHTTPATVADHDPPHKGDYQIFLSGKLRSICKRHHDSDKALMEAGKTISTTGEDGWPVE